MASVLSGMAPSCRPTATRSAAAPPPILQLDRKSTRLNSSHLVISYAVFCLKKKKNKSTLSSNQTAVDKPTPHHTHGAKDCTTAHPPHLLQSRHRMNTNQCILPCYAHSVPH